MAGRLGAAVSPAVDREPTPGSPSRPRSGRLDGAPRPESDEHAEDFHALAELAEAFTELVAALREGDPPDLTPAAIVDLARRCMPHGQHVAIAACVDGTMSTLATSSEIPSRIDRIRDETREGPALDVIETTMSSSAAT
jgi:hypothetical protein